LATSRTVTWIWPAASRELEQWREHANRIPDEELREDALESIALKRDNAQGAAIFCILPTRRQPQLLKLLVAYQTLWDYLDNVSERGAILGSKNGYQLHRALVEALDPRAPISDYYRHHSKHADGGYIRELVLTCRKCCEVLPAYHQVRSLVLDGVRHCAIQGINHLPERHRRERELKVWARQQEAAHTHLKLRWFELTAAASAFLPHALLALAAEPVHDGAYMAQIGFAYFPWMALSIAMLDSYVDALEDLATGSHSYIAHYEDQQVMCERLREILASTLHEADRLPNGSRHVLLAASMMAMYLSNADQQSLELTKQIAAGGGSLTRLLIPAARLWRTLDRRRTCEVAQQQRPQRVPRRTLPAQTPAPAPLQTFLFWRYPFRYLLHCRERYGPTFTLNASSHPPLIFLSDAQEIRSIIAAPEEILHPGEGGNAISPIVGEGSFMLSDGVEHQAGRKAVIAALHAGAVERHAHTVVQAAERAVTGWPTDKVTALHPGLKSLTLEVILRTLIGRFAGPVDDLTLALRDRVLEMLQVTASPVFIEPHLRHGPGRRTWQRFLCNRAQVDRLLFQLIDERRQTTTSPGGDLLGALEGLPTSDGSRPSPRQVRDNAMSLILAGHETTAAQIAWAFQLLAHNPPVRERLHEEIDAGTSEEYLTATIQEVLRHRCVFVFAIPRAVAAPVEIDGHVHRSPAQLLACIYLLHHDPAIYPDPHAFRPDRFLDAPPDPRAWIPWGGGRKRCPGLHLAMLEMKTVLRTVLTTRTVQPASNRMERPRWRSVIVAPHAGSRVILRARSR